MDDIQISGWYSLGFRALLSLQLNYIQQCKINVFIRHGDNLFCVQNYAKDWRHLKLCSWSLSLLFFTTRWNCNGYLGPKVDPSARKSPFSPRPADILVISGRQDLFSAPSIEGCINKQDLKDGNDADMRRHVGTDKVSFALLSNYKLQS